MLLQITHATRYDFGTPAGYSLQQVRLTPKTSSGQIIKTWETRIEGGIVEFDYMDHHNNKVQLISLIPGVSQTTLLVTGVVSTTNSSGIFGKHKGQLPLWAFMRPTPLTKSGQGVAELANEIDMTDPLTGLHEVAALISSRVIYKTDQTHSQTTVEEALELGYGVCQDHAQIFVSAARHAGIPARYVSGYLMMDGVEEQAASHAWAEAHIEDLGWVGFDVSNGISPDERYVRVATGFDYADAAPISGIRFGDSGETMSVSIQVQQQ